MWKMTVTDLWVELQARVRALKAKRGAIANGQERGIALAGCDQAPVTSMRARAHSLSVAQGLTKSKSKTRKEG
jgi:hypothetical protein